MTCRRSVKNWESFGKSTTSSLVLPRAGKKVGLRASVGAMRVGSYRRAFPSDVTE